VLLGRDNVIRLHSQHKADFQDSGAKNGSRGGQVGEEDGRVVLGPPWPYLFFPGQVLPRIETHSHDPRQTYLKN
jgi:hypothetical protein